jgi:hypothetical protein
MFGQSTVLVMVDDTGMFFGRMTGRLSNTTGC